MESGVGSDSGDGLDSGDGMLELWCLDRGDGLERGDGCEWTVVMVMAWTEVIA